MLVLRYEDFLSERQQTVQKVLEHAMRRGLYSEQRIRAGAAGVGREHQSGALTDFPSGKSGGWRKAFNDEHRQLFQQVAGDLVDRLGYEA